MMTMLWSGWVLVSLLPVAVVKAQCAKFEFPTAEPGSQGGGLTVRLSENQNETIPFTLYTHNCSHFQQQAITITVSRKEKNGGLFQDVCKLRVNGSQVLPFNNGCQQEEKGRYSLSKRVVRSDSTSWRWRASFNGTTLESVLLFDVTYPPKITQFSILPGAKKVTRGEDVDVVCRYEKGNPDVTPRLVDARGRELRATEKPGEVTHTMRNVNCDDTGRVGCKAEAEAAGPPGIWTEMLLVQCPPKFQGTEVMQKPFIVRDDDTHANLTFQLRSHTTALSACWVSPQPPTKVLDCLSNFKMSGSPPNMTLTLQMTSQMTSGVVRTWRLNVTNDGGSDDVIFAIPIPFLNVSTSSSEPARGNSLEAAPLDEHTTPTTTPAVIATGGSLPEFSDNDREEENSDEDEGGQMPQSSSSPLLSSRLYFIVVGCFLVFSSADGGHGGK